MQSNKTPGKRFTLYVILLIVITLGLALSVSFLGDEEEISTINEFNSFETNTYYMNATNYYVEGYYYNSTGGGTPYTITIGATNTNYNLTNWSAGEYNGFTFVDNGVTANHTGIYQLSGSITFTGGNDEYAFTMAKNNIPIPKCGMGRTGTSTSRDNVALTCLVSLEEGDHLNLFVMDKNTPPTDVDIYKTNLNIIKISD